MAMTGHTVIGVFDEAGMADRTIDALQNAGFGSSQIYHTGRSASGGGFWAGLRNFFGGNTSESESHVANDLEGMGVSEKEANYYENEYGSGHTILAVRADKDPENVWSIMQTNGAYNYSSRMGGSGITNTNTDTTAGTSANAGTGTTVGGATTDAILRNTAPTNNTPDVTRTGTATNAYTPDATRTDAANNTFTKDATRTGTTTNTSTTDAIPTGTTNTSTTDATRTGPNDYPSTDVTNTGTPASQRAANNINSDADTSDTVMPLNTTGYDATRTGSTTNTGQGADYTNTGTDEAQRLRLREEQLNVNKQPVQTGEVQLHKGVVEEQKTVNVPVTHEEVYVERRPATGSVDDNTPIGQGEDIRVPVSQEQVNVNKNTVTTGEVSVGKRAVQENQQVTDTVRHEEARLDQSGNPRVSGTDLNNDNTNTTNP